MGKLTLKEKIKQHLGYLGFKLYLWANNITHDEFVELQKQK